MKNSIRYVLGEFCKMARFMPGEGTGPTKMADSVGRVPSRGAFRRSLYVLGLAAFSGLVAWSPGAVANRTWESELPGHWKMINVSNGYMDLGVAPEMGGRIMNLRLRDSDFNVVRVERPEYLQLRLKDVNPELYGLNYGGIRDVHSPGWPGLDFNDKTYAAQVSVGSNGEPASIWSEATANGVRSQRRMTLLPHSTILRIDVTLTNLRPQFLDLMCRLNAELNVGNGKNYTVMPDGKGGLEKVAYILGREFGRGMRPSRGDWIAKVDVANKTAMLLRYPADQVKEFLLWSGATGGECAAQTWETIPLDYFGFTGINLFSLLKETPPGGQVAFYQEHSLYSGLTMVDLVHERTLMQLDTDRQVYNGQETVSVRIGAARPENGPPFTVKVEMLDSAGNLLQSKELQFACPEIGKAEWLEWSVPAPPWKDGELTARLSAFGATAAKTVQVDSPSLAKLAGRREALKKEITALQAMAGLDHTTEAAMAGARLAEMRPLAEQRDLQAEDKALSALEKDVARWKRE